MLFSPPTTNDFIARMVNEGYLHWHEIRELCPFTNDFIKFMLSKGNLDPDDVAELKRLVPRRNIVYRPSDAALLCALFPTLMKTEVLPQNNNRIASVRALFTAARDQQTCKNPAFRTAIVTIDCQGLRFCLVSRKADNVRKILASFSVFPISHLSASHPEHTSLLEEAADIVQNYLLQYREQDLNDTAGYDEMHKKRRRKGSFRRYSSGYSSGVYGSSAGYSSGGCGYDMAPERGVAQQMPLFSKMCLPPSRPRRLCTRLGVTVGLFHRTTFEVDGHGGFIVEQKSQQHSNRQGATVEGGVTVGLDPSVNVSVGRQLADTTYLRVSGSEHLKLVLEKMRYHRKVRWWFLSMLLTETVLVDAESKADAFLPSSIRRREGVGLRLDDPMPAWFFEIIGGTVFSVGRDVYFKAFSMAGTAKKVERIEEGGRLRIGDHETSYVLGGCYWELGGLEIGLNLSYERDRDELLS